MLGYSTFYFKLPALTVTSITAALAGLLNALHKPIVSPEIAHVGLTVDALLIILIGSMGTLGGVVIGTALCRLLEFCLHKRFSESAAFLLGGLYAAFVLFVPYGIVGIYRLRRLHWKEGWERLLRLVTSDGEGAHSTV